MPAAISKLIAPNIQKIKAYTPIQADRSYIRLDAMESPCGFTDLPPNIYSKWLESLRHIEVNRYPLSWSNDIELRLKDTLNLCKSVSILPGNGSDELIMLLIILCGGTGVKVLSPSPSFSMYSHITNVLGGRFIGVNLNKDFSLDSDLFIKAIKQHTPNIIFISQPNNPTANFFPEYLIKIALEESSALVVIDRAYDFFCHPINSPTLNVTKYPNLVEIRTLSKIGMAGLRFGFASACPELIKELNKVRLPYNINILTKQSILFALDNISYFLQWSEDTVARRNHLYSKLQQINEIEVYPTETNFLLFKSKNLASNIITQKLKEKKILIKNLNDYHPLLQNCLRVSIGNNKENELFLQQFKKLL